MTPPAALTIVLAVLSAACATTRCRERIDARRGTAPVQVSESPARGDQSLPSTRPAPAASVQVATPDGADLSRAPGVPEAQANEHPSDRAPAIGPPTADGIRRTLNEAVSAYSRPGQAAARALHEIARMLEDMAGDSSSASVAIQQVRSDLAQLEALDPVDLDRTDRLKAALQHAVDAMTHITSVGSSAGLHPWIDAAASAVRLVDRAMPLPLQRAAVQDALRAIADAVLVMRQFGGRYEGPHAHAEAPRG